MSCSVHSSLFIGLCIDASCSLRNGPRLGEESTKQGRGNPPFGNTSLTRWEGAGGGGL